MQKLFSIILSFFMLLPSAAGVKAEDEITVTVDGEAVEFDTEPVIENDRVLVPVRAIFEEIGAVVDWIETSKTVMAMKWGNDKIWKSVYIGIGQDMMRIYEVDTSLFDSEVFMPPEVLQQNQGYTVELDTPAIIVNDRTLVPLRAVSEAFGYDVDWEGDTRTVIITSPESENADFSDDSRTATICPVKPDYVSMLMNKLPSDENYVISPLSLRMAMLMAANGADGDTKQEILNAFDIYGSIDIDSYNDRIKELTERFNSVEDGEVDIANSIWFNKDFYKNIPNADFSENFKEIVSKYYGGTADVVTNKDSVEKVNDWVKDKTNGKITSLVPESQRKYLAALVNAVYMKADWVKQFDANDTYEEEFTDINGKKTKTEFMHRTDHFNYYEDDEGNKIIELPYRNGLSMYIVLGDTKYFDPVYMPMSYKKAEVSIPKFKIEYSKELNDVLKDLGVERAFSDSAEFESMVENVPDPVKIDKVLQKAVIEVDEKGTEAAAATYVGMVGLTALPMQEETVEFKADKPFTYYIADKTSGEVLFSGRYVKVGS